MHSKGFERADLPSVAADPAFLEISLPRGEHARHNPAQAQSNAPLREQGSSVPFLSVLSRPNRPSCPSRSQLRRRLLHSSRVFGSLHPMLQFCTTVVVI